MEKVWLKSYPAGVPAEFDVGALGTLVDMFESSVERFGERPAFRNLGATLTFAELDRLSRDFAAWLQNESGLAPGDRIALMMPNTLQYPVALYGALRAGLVVVNVNPLYTAHELEQQLCDSEAAAIVVLENFARTVEQVLGRTALRTVITTGLGDLLGLPRSLLVNAAVRHLKRMVPAYDLPGARALRPLLARGRTLPFTPARPAPEDLAFLQYTGGTTGVAKGAMLTHRNMMANIEQARLWLSGVLDERGEVVVTALPLYHVFALLANCLLFTRLGGLNLLVTNPRDLRAFVATLRGVRFTAISGVNTLFNALLKAPGFDRLDFSGLKLALAGGMALQRPVAQRWKHLTGVTLIEAYGLTEASPAVSVNPWTLPEFNGSIGLPLPGTEISIRNPEDKEQSPGLPGELCVRGPQVMRGYWRREGETAQVLSADGWLRTGDIVTVDRDGYLHLVDRKKDTIIVSGFNVYPNEIEAVVASHPGVREVGAIGIPDPHSGEAVKIVVVRQDPALTAEQLLAHCRTSLTHYKLPRVIEFRSELPKTPVGKILRRALREAGTH